MGNQLIPYKLSADRRQESELTINIRKATSIGENFPRSWSNEWQLTRQQRRLLPNVGRRVSDHEAVYSLIARETCKSVHCLYMGSQILAVVLGGHESVRDWALSGSGRSLNCTLL